MEVLMGKRNELGIAKRNIRGRARWFIDFLWIDRDGRQQRYRRMAKVQNREGALLESRHLQDRALRTGSLDVKDAAPTMKDFVAGTFTKDFLPRYRKATRERYQALFDRVCSITSGRCVSTRSKRRP
jgi:hypothetical protein